MMYRKALGTMRTGIFLIGNDMSSSVTSSRDISAARFGRVLLVGHCGADSGSLSYLAHQAMGLEAARVNSDAALAREATADALLWINRVLEGSFEAGDGLALVRQLAAGDTPQPMMLITNYADIQQAAVAAGAMPGFGKSDIGSDALTQRLARLMHGEQDA